MMFLHKLALALGMTTGRLRKEMSLNEMNHWLAFYKLHPFGEDRADLRAGIITSGIRNAHRTKGKPDKPKDFMPDFMREGRMKSQAALKRILSSMAHASGGKVVHHG